MELEISNFDDNYDKCLDKLPLARAYIPSQQYKRIYPMGEALNAGTIFPELNLYYKKPNKDYRPELLC